jgi:hypothetical protein
MGFGVSSNGTKRGKGDFSGLLLVNKTQRSTSDAEYRLFKKNPGVGAFLSFMGHCVMEIRNGLVVASEVSQTAGKTERDATLQIDRSLSGEHQKSPGTEKGYDTWNW